MDYLLIGTLLVHHVSFINTHIQIDGIRIVQAVYEQHTLDLELHRSSTDGLEESSSRIHGLSSSLNHIQWPLGNIQISVPVYTYMFSSFIA